MVFFICELPVGTNWIRYSTYMFYFLPQLKWKFKNLHIEKSLEMILVFGGRKLLCKETLESMAHRWCLKSCSSFPLSLPQTPRKTEETGKGRRAALVAQVAFRPASQKLPSRLQKSLPHPSMLLGPWHDTTVYTKGGQTLPINGQTVNILSQLLSPATAARKQPQVTICNHTSVAVFEEYFTLKFKVQHNFHVLVFWFFF